jgi:uncharacterized protein YacL
MALVYLRCLVLVICAVGAVVLHPLAPASLSPGGLLLANALFGLAAGGLGILLEWSMRTVPFRLIVGGIVGLMLGAAAALVLMRAMPPGLRLGGWPVAPDLATPVIYLSLALAGSLIGSYKAGNFRADTLWALLRPQEDRRNGKILDTSVIIDGRIADICETGFLEGTLILPQFVLRELQYVADSSDTIKRNRGRKGLEILQRIKKSADVDVQVSEVDFPEVKQVDDKIIELARRLGAKIVTNDFNLNKVAQLHGVDVLNINELANSLKPVVLPGEMMHVFILKEGKESNQGVAYLDDGTMVVVDNARKYMGRTVEIIVTSVLQTTAGKMFFGRVAGDPDKTPVRRPPREARDPGETPPETAPAPNNDHGDEVKGHLLR